MCMLTYYAPGASIDEEALTNGSHLNDDGHGFAIVAGDRLIIDHGMDFGAVLARFKAARAEHPDGPALFHSRFGTGGERSTRNCHPFRVFGDRRTVVAHNGVFGADVQPTGADRRCDTRIVAEEVMPGMNYDDETEMTEFAEWMTTANKVVILTVNPRFKHQAYIVNGARGNWQGDVWYSNHDWQPYYGSGFNVSSFVKAANRGLIDDWTWEDDAARGVDDEGICPACKSDADVEREARLCIACHLCLDCLDTWDDCECWTPGNRATSGSYGALEVIDGDDDGPVTEEDAAERANAAVLGDIVHAADDARADMVAEGLFRDPRPADASLVPYSVD